MRAIGKQQPPFMTPTLMTQVVDRRNFNPQLFVQPKLQIGAVVMAYPQMVRQIFPNEVQQFPEQLQTAYSGLMLGAMNGQAGLSMGLGFLGQPLLLRGQAEMRYQDTNSLYMAQTRNSSRGNGVPNNG
jgi:hypothetical protein